MCSTSSSIRSGLCAESLVPVFIHSTYSPDPRRWDAGEDSLLQQELAFDFLSDQEPEFFARPSHCAFSGVHL